MLIVIKTIHMFLLKVSIHPNDLIRIEVSDNDDIFF
jgi:hypothetical protein